ncbi:macrophage mannose receptor 1-like [Tachypleus tridentatus]|uniref:macrophage mannose receptor 1-like n=1 Tax=Tachypleus tridentatus TaxID=6853 RepID=UPI003FCF7648
MGFASVLMCLLLCHPCYSFIVQSALQAEASHGIDTFLEASVTYLQQGTSSASLLECITSCSSIINCSAINHGQEIGDCFCIIGGYDENTTEVKYRANYTFYSLKYFDPKCSESRCVLGKITGSTRSPATRTAQLSTSDETTTATNVATTLLFTEHSTASSAANPYIGKTVDHYHVSSQLFTYDAGKTYCDNQNGALFMPKSQMIHDFIGNWINTNFNSHRYCWIGVNDKMTTDTYMFLDGADVTQFFWTTSHMSDSVQSCVAMDRDQGYEWVELPCTEEHFAVCQIWEVQSTTVVASSSTTQMIGQSTANPYVDETTTATNVATTLLFTELSTASSTANPYIGKTVDHYHVSSQLFTYDAGKTYCDNQNGALFMPKSQMIHDFIGNWINTNFNSHRYCWIGVNDKMTTDTYMFLDGADVTQFFWTTSHMSDSVQSCVAMDRDQGYEWVELPCTEEHFAVCQIWEVQSTTVAASSSTTQMATQSTANPYVGKTVDHYHVSSQLFTYNAGKTYCDNQNGALFMPKSQMIHDFIGNWINTNFNSHRYCWIGVNDKMTTDTYMFLDGADVTQFFWTTSHMSDSVQSCVAMDRDQGYEWVELPCTEEHFAVCQIWEVQSTTVVASSSTTQMIGQSTANPYVGKTPSSYKTDSQLLTYTGGKAHCDSQNGALLMAKSKSTHDFIAGWLNSSFSTYRYYWIGVNDKMTTDTYMFLDGTEVTQFFWTTSHVSDGVQSCVAMDREEDFKWVELSCTEEHRAVCQIWG